MSMFHAPVHGISIQDLVCTFLTCIRNVFMPLCEEVVWIDGGVPCEQGTRSWIFIPQGAISTVRREGGEYSNAESTEKR